MPHPDLSTGEVSPAILIDFPKCIACLDDGKKTPAHYLLPQSLNALAGKPVSWVLICRSHADGWNFGGDNWLTYPPGYALVPLPSPNNGS